MTLRTELTNPYTKVFNHCIRITPSDVADIPAPSPGFVDAIFAPGGGDLTVDTGGGENSVLLGRPWTSPLFLRVTRVRATGTTATDIFGFW